MTQQLDPGVTRRIHLVVRRRARTFRRAVAHAHRHAGWGGAAEQAATLVGELALRPLRRWRERRLDQRLQLDTAADTGLVHPDLASATAGAYPDGVAYSPTPLHHFQKLLDRLSITDPAQFAFVDLGCGKGRTLVVAAEHGFRPVIGVELDLRLTGIARRNIRWYAFAAAAQSRQCPITVVNSDAVAYEFPTVPTVVFLFNPFGADTLGAVVANLERSLTAAPRRLVVAYFNAAHRAILDASPALCVAASTRNWVIYQTVAESST